MSAVSRRLFLSVASGSVAVQATSLRLPSLPLLRAEEAKLDVGLVRFRPEIEPLVRLLEETPREKVVDVVCDEIQRGRSYREWLAALFLAGIRNVQPRPSVGFKFHTVLVVHSAHQASMSASDESRWLPLLWGIDYFKSAQASDVKEGDWTMLTVDERRLPETTQALGSLQSAMETWDVAAADTAAAAATRVATSSQLLDVLARYAARDFRSIGHKAIYLAGAFRTLGVIGWEHAEPVIRSLAYAILNHTGEANPAQNELDADRAGRRNWELVDSIGHQWLAGQRDHQATARVFESLRETSPLDSAKLMVDMLNAGVHPRSLYDGMMLAASELITRQPAIVPLHAVTTTNALHYLFHSVGDDRLRRWLLLQNASFIAHFRQAAQARDKLADRRIDEWEIDRTAAVSLDDVFEKVHRDRRAASLATMQYLRAGGDAEAMMRKARELVFLKGTDSHDYKFSSAAIEDFYAIDPRWRDHYLAGCSYLLHGSSEKTTELAEKVLART